MSCRAEAILTLLSDYADGFPSEDNRGRYVGNALDAALAEVQDMQKVIGTMQLEADNLDKA